ncbi:hypothetical protein J4711_13650 [Staphylococcus epidermidis]|nr:hypothetical protein [Staphylococcus epidermidis]
MVKPFTQITAAQVRAGEFVSRNSDELPRTLAYLDQLEAQGSYTLMVWPMHCEIGSWPQCTQPCSRLIAIGKKDSCAQPTMSSKA